MVTLNRPQLISVLTVTREYELGRPQYPIAPVQEEIIPEFDNEIIEEVATIFDNLLYDEGSAPNQGFVLIENG